MSGHIDRTDKTEKIEGIIMKGVGGLYTVRLPLNTDDPDAPRYVTCPARGKFRHENVTPYPGDRVILEKESDAWAVGEILPRRTTLHRPAIENVTHLVAVIPAAKPKPDLETVDKLICCAESAGIEPIIVVNKADLDRTEAERIERIYVRAGFTVFLISAATGEGVGSVKEYLSDLAKAGADKPGADTSEANTSDTAYVSIVFSGASGAGKSTLLTALFPDLDLRTGDVSRKTSRGRHTTRTAELFEISDGLFLADTPGFTMLDFANYNFFPHSELCGLFREFLPYTGDCRYTKCTHLCEEGCRVCEAVESGAIPAERHENYKRIYAEMKKTPDWKRRQMEW